MSKIEELIKKLCPNGVEFKKLEEITKSINIGINPRKFFKLNPADSTGFYVTVRELNGLKGVKEYEKTDKINDEAIQIINNRANIEKGDILFSNTGTVGKLALVNETPTNWGVNEGIYIIKPIEEKILSKYLYYYLDSSHAYKDYSSKFTGSTLKHVTQKALASLIVAVPPLEVQREIVHILDDFTLLSAELSAELKARQKQYDFYKQKVFDSIKTKKIKHITDIALVKARVGWQRLTKSEYLNSGNYYLITGTDFTTDGNINFESCVYVAKDRYEMDKNIQVHKDDILITKDGTLGKVAILKEEPSKETTLNSGVFRIKVLDDKEVYPKYLYHFFTSKYFKDFVESVKTGSTIPHLTQQGLVTLDIPIPSLEEQIKLSGLLDNFDILTNDITEGLPAEIEARRKQYEYYRDKLLTFKELKVNE